jgi:hypothetical protein
LWRSKTSLQIGGIVEYYCWICRHTRPNNTTRANLEPAYQVTYNWDFFQYTVERLSQHPRI